jgi:hypothetical protein
VRRTKVINTIKDFPAEFELDELLERLVFIDKVEKGIKQVKKGKTISNAKVKELVKKW